MQNHKRVEFKRVLIAAPEVQAIAVKECNEPLVDYHENRSVLDTGNPDSERKSTLVRKTVKDMLEFAQTFLPSGFQLQNS